MILTFLGISALLLELNMFNTIKSSKATTSWSATQEKYIPSQIEKYFLEHTAELGFDKKMSSGCKIWKRPNTTRPEIYQSLQAYKKDIENYTAVLQNFAPIPDLIETIKRTGNHKVCARARPHPDGIQALFPSMQLSKSKSGFVEPLFPPMRDHRMCDNFDKNLMKMDYLVHDFEAMCYALKPTSKRVLIDMGASLEFGNDKNIQPIMFLLDQYEKFGFHFDHIYAFEVTHTKPSHVFDMVPEKYMPSYHWINVGVKAEEGHKLNPLHSILETFDEDDFIVVKLDIDASHIEVPLARQLLEDKKGVYQKLVDQFYFEHHVGLSELRWNWILPKENPESVGDSLRLFAGLREKGIPAHFWP